MLTTKIRITDGKIPEQKNIGDVGYDIHLTRLVGEPKDNIYTFGTGIFLTPPTGYHYKMFGRSSLPSTGFILATGVSIIDEGYTGEIFVKLLKISPSKPDLELPFRAVQIVLEVTHKTQFVTVNELATTDRGNGGFGSTDIIDFFGYYDNLHAIKLNNVTNLSQTAIERYLIQYDVVEYNEFWEFDKNNLVKKFNNFADVLFIEDETKEMCEKIEISNLFVDFGCNGPYVLKYLPTYSVKATFMQNKGKSGVLVFRYGKISPRRLEYLTNKNIDCKHYNRKQFGICETK